MLERSDEETSPPVPRSFPGRLLQASQLGESLGRPTRSERPDNEGRGERLLSGLERELMKRLKSVLERLDLPNRRELEELNQRLRGLEKRLNEQLSTKRVPKRKIHRRKPSPR